MPVYIDKDICNGCHGSKNPPCMKLCPGDLIFIDNEKAILREKKDCWNCYVCVKACPIGAIEMKLSYQMGFFNSTLKPYKISDDMIGWKAIDINGNVEEFKIKTKYIAEDNK